MHSANKVTQYLDDSADNYAENGFAFQKYS